ncbi:hypothetical protein [Bradyrhizobium iriomotense]|uniref:hypothetical protein n=1 Tax=Bradyrhizobium iriomotense TaxID=441950 RepID=UPI001B8A5269|nr:hypothetical protein [Bradyrhizobium iriomotense]MBR1131914.1 hypothetical protein [Bradyrhizobium iriomotense]
MSRVGRLQADFMAASGDLAAARRGLADEQFKARHGMPHATAFATMRESTAFHRWLGIGEALAAVAPKPAPKAPAAPSTPRVARPAMPAAATSNPPAASAADSYKVAKREADRVQAEYDALARELNHKRAEGAAAYARMQRAHDAAVAAVQARHNSRTQKD